MKWDKDKIKSILPHKDPFLFVDEVVDIDNNALTAVKYVRPDEYFFTGHFPGNPVMPGVLILEAMAQAAILLYAVAKPGIAEQHPTYYLGTTKAEFLAPVFPNNTLTLHIIGVKITDSAGIADGRAYVGDTLAAKASFTFGIKPHA